jgi:phosphoglycolate phosphatase
MNSLLEQESLPGITVEKYREIFTFPVIDYYKQAGHTFEKNSFEVLGKVFMEEYEIRKMECNLFPDVRVVLNEFKNKNINQYLLSAYKQDLLDKTVKYFELNEYFKEIIGLDNIYAGSKIQFGKELISIINSNGRKENILLIGDTQHDLEVAQAIGVDCILISSGHQSEKRLSGLSGVTVIPDLDSLLSLLNN